MYSSDHLHLQHNCSPLPNLIQKNLRSRENCGMWLSMFLLNIQEQEKQAPVRHNLSCLDRATLHRHWKDTGRELHSGISRNSNEFIIETWKKKIPQHLFVCYASACLTFTSDKTRRGCWRIYSIVLGFVKAMKCNATLQCKSSSFSLACI